jgi:hypothetical protein
MTAASETTDTRWWCAGCAIMEEAPLADAPSVDSVCAKCGKIADPCAAALRAVLELRAELEADRRAAAVSAATAPPVDDTIDATAAAELLKLPSVKALYAAVQRAQVPALRFGRRLRFSRSALEELIRKVA